MEEVETVTEHDPERLGTIEVYGFIGWIATYVFCGTVPLSHDLRVVILSTWLFLPEDWMERMGVTYVVNREYALSLPIILVTTVGFVLILNQAFNLIHTVSPSSYYTIKDEYSHELDMESMKEAEDKGRIAEIYDIPITTVNKLLYEKSKFGATERKQPAARTSDKMTVAPAY